MPYLYCMATATTTQVSSMNASIVPVSFDTACGQYVVYKACGSWFFRNNATQEVKFLSNDMQEALDIACKIIS